MLNIISIMAGAALLGSSQQATDKATLTGTVQNFKSDIAVLVDMETYGRDTISVAANGSFSFEKDIKTPGFSTLYFPDTKVFLNLFLENGTQTNVKGDVEQPEKFEIEGELEPIYPFSQSVDRLFKTHAEQASVKGFAAYQKDLTSLRDSLMTALETMPSKGFQAYETEQLAKNLKFSFVVFYQYLKENKVPLDSDADYNAFMNGLDLNDEANMSTGLLAHYLYWQSMLKAGEINTLSMLQLMKEKVSNPAIIDNMAGQFGYSYFATGGDEHIEEVYALVSEMIPNQLGKIIPVYEKIKTFAPGKPAVDFEMSTPDGKTLKFSDLKGKIVYVDVWATWCGPCRMEIPFMKKLAGHYKDNPKIQLVSISVDGNVEAWKKMVEKEGFDWPQYVAPGDFNSPLTKGYAIGGIPRFMMFDAEGKIITVNAPRPSEEKIIEFIDSKLK